MNLYRINNWNTLFENNRTRELKKLDWVPLPNKQDGDGYTAIMDMKNGATIFGAWVACVQIASRCDPRGTLLRDGKKPHDPASLSRMSRVPERVISEMLKLLSSPDINWLTVETYNNPAGGCDVECGIPAGGCLEGKGRERREGKEKNGSVFSVSLPLLKVEINKHFDRRLDAPWGHDEERALAGICQRPDAKSEWDVILNHRRLNPGPYQRKSVRSLLEHWPEELDKARAPKPPEEPGRLKPAKDIFEKELDAEIRRLK